MTDPDLRKEAIALVRELISAELSEEREDQIIARLSVIVPDPEFSDYIYYSDPQLTAEEVVVKAFEYKPIQH